MDQFEQKLLLKEIKKLINIECVKADTDLSKLSIAIGFGSGYISNMFSKNSTISLHILYAIGKELNCDIAALLPDIKKILK